MYDDRMEEVGPALVCEPARSSPFLTDGEDIYVIEGWRAERRSPWRVVARRLEGAERDRVRRSLLEAAEEAVYALPKGRSGKR